VNNSQKLSYENATELEQRLIIEPWAEQYVIQPGQRVDIVVQSDAPAGCLELEQRPGGLTIYGYTGCIISVLSDGEELAPDC